MHRIQPTAVVVVAIAALLTLGACGDDETETSTATTDAPDAPDAPDAEPGDDDLAAYCDAEIDLDQAFQVIDADDPSTFEAALATASSRVDAVVDLAPTEVADEIGVLRDAFAEVVETQAVESFFTDDVDAADTAVHAFDLAHCGWSATDVSAEDFLFDADFPSTAGATTFEVTNEGDEPHLLIVARKHDDVDAGALDAFNALEAEEDFPASFDQAASVFVAPGDSDFALADLEPGEYIAFCPIPIGSAPDAGGDGPPHFTEGMITEFEVS